MADSSKIEWTDATWNPTVGCSVLSPGCTNCYAMKMAARLEAMGQSIYAGTTKPSKAGAVWTGKVQLNEAALLKPLSWKRPRRIFVNSMSDLFHENLPDTAIDRVFDIMESAHNHIYQVLTKRSERQRDYVSRRTQALPFRDRRHIWLGVSCERQQEADERIPHLLQTPAAIRFVSAEPLLGAIDLDRIPDGSNGMRFSALSGIYTDGIPAGWKPPLPYPVHLDWIIVGGESGPNARPMHPQWARDIQKQCDDADVRFFFKQWGAWAPQFDECGNQHPSVTALTPVHVFKRTEHIGTGMVRVGKKLAGRLLDGKEYNEFPSAARAQSKAA